MPQATPSHTTPTPISRQVVEAQIDLLIDMLNQMDGDPDLEPDLAGYSLGMDSREGDDSDDEPGSDDEPSLGWLGAGCTPEDSSQDSFLHFWGSRDNCTDLEDEHDGAEPDVDSEMSLGWRNEGPQTGEWAGHPLDNNDTEGTSPEWPADPVKVLSPKRRRAAPDVPTISNKDCTRLAA